MDSQYELKLRSEEKGKVYRFESADGINSKNSFRDEELLLADKLDIGSEDRVLIVQSGFGFLGSIFGDKAEKVVMYETSARASEFSRKNCKSNDIENFEVVNKPEISDIEEVFDKVVYSPANYTPVELVKKRLAQATTKIISDGDLYISGRKKTGLKRYRNFLKQFSQPEKIGKRDGIKAYKFSKFTEPPEVNIEKSFKANLNGDELEFKTSEGLFSSGKLDEGTRILLENIKLQKPGKVLDLACGYGAVSVFMSKQYNAQYYLSDDNARAIKYAKENLEHKNVNDFEFETSDCLNGFPNEKFEVIVSNPPTHQGKSITDKMFEQAAEALKDEGEFWLVFNQNMKFQEQLRDLFSSVKTVSRQKNFAVVKAVK